MFSKYFFIVVFIVILIFGKTSYSQQIKNSKWKHFIKSESINDYETDSTNLICQINIKDSIFIKHGPKSGIKILRQLDKNTVIGSILYKDYNILKKKNATIYMANHLWKLSDNLHETKIEKEGIVFLKSANPDRLTKYIQTETDFNILFTRNGLIVLSGNISEIINTLIENRDVEYIGKEDIQAKVESKIPDSDLSVNLIEKIHEQFPGANGQETTISIKGLKFDCDNIDLLGKCIDSGIESEIIGSHATDMATIIAGSGNSSKKGKGVARACKISSSDFQNILPDSRESLENLDVLVQNHSYGTKIENFYGALAEAYDQFAFENPNLQHVFSSGNSGDSISSSGKYAGLEGYANLTGNFKMAKNIITVGAINQKHQLMPFSSRGPAYDGRIKPELVAFSTTGTSNSTALVSGICLLLQQQFKINHNKAAPSSLIKAVLINSAMDIGIPGPDFSTGFGNVNAYNSLQTIKENSFFLDSIENNKTKQYIVNISDSSYQLKVTLVWTDPQAPANSNIALINDLDLRLTDSHGAEWQPWVPDNSPIPASLETPALRGVDHLNNIEQITLNNTPPGAYKFEVNGFNVESGKQNFAIAYQWEQKNKFEWVFPIKNSQIEYDDFSGGYFQWLSTYQSAVGDLYISYNYGGSWQKIADNIDLDDKNYNRMPENPDKNLAMLKMEINNAEYLSDTFVISANTILELGLNCEETLELRWDKSQNSERYEVFNLQGNLMQKVGETLNNTYVFNRNQFSSTQFAIQPVYKNEIPGIRSQSINIADFDTSCYINSFYALQPEKGNNLRIYLNLGSLHEVDNLEIFRINENGSLRVETINQPDSLEYIIADTSPAQGINYYMAYVNLVNNKQYSSERIFSYFLTDNPFLVFPNPTNNRGVNIFTKNFGAEKVIFRLYTIEGSLILSENLESDRNFINLQNIGSGMYIYKLESSSGLIEINKLLIY